MRTALLWAVLPALAFAAVVPSSSAPVAVEVDAETPASPFIVELVPELARAKFGVPCVDCLGGDSAATNDQALLFDVQVLPSDRSCGQTSLDFNGQPLGLEWEGLEAHGQWSLSSVHVAHNLSISWAVLCQSVPTSETSENLQDAPVVLFFTAKVLYVDGVILPVTTGFTMSYMQLAEPQLLRLDASPSTSGDPLYVQEGPGPIASISEGGDSDGSSEQSHDELDHVDHMDDMDDMEIVEDQGMSIEDQIQELKILKEQARMLESVIYEKKRLLKGRFKSGCKHLAEEIKQCDGVVCVLKAIIRHTEKAARLLYLRLKPIDHTSEAEPLLLSNHLSQAPATAGGRLPKCADGKPGCFDEKSAHNATTDGSFDPSSFFEDYPQSPAMRILSYLASALGLTALISFIHRCCRAGRHRADRLAARDEQRRARLYRRAARKAAWNAWWSRNFRFGRRASAQPQPPTNWDEKSARVMAQEAVLETDMQAHLARLTDEAAMRNELRAFRRAHGVVDALVRAEEGEVAPLLAAVERPRRFSGSGSLPEYRTDESGSEAGLSEPPAYSEDESEVVVDGFREYSPSGSSHADWTPASSVIDVSTRPSAETLRTAEGKV